MKILDCTLRDGGYYNKWDFEHSVVENYIHAMADSGVEYVELGLRNFPKKGFLGAFAYTTEEYLNKLRLPDGPTYGVMVDAKTVLNSELDIDEAIDYLFVNSSESKIDLVRVAAHFHEVNQCERIVKKLRELGYVVGLNLMQSGGKPSEQISSLSKQVSTWQCVNVLYFADSLGNMDRVEVERIYNAVRQGWKGEIGIHTHDNMGKALDNTMSALDLGVTWVDTTITGMGRGAGNAQTERLLAILSKQGLNYKPDSVYKLVIESFSGMQKHYGWGANLLYFLGAQNNVHPTYVQTLMTDSHYSPEIIVNAIEYLSKSNNSQGFSDELLTSALNFSDIEKEVTGSDRLKGLFDGKDVLILGKGESANRYKDDIEHYIRIKKPTVININADTVISSSLVDYYCISHNVKFLEDRDKYSSLNKPIILPAHRFTEEELDSLKTTNELYDYGLEVSEDGFSVENFKCQIPSDITIAYAFAAACVGNSKHIKVIGLDGFDAEDKRHVEMINVISEYRKTQDTPIESLTPTTYPIDEGSLFAPVK